MKRRMIAVIAAAGFAAAVGLGSTPAAHAESKCPVWMCGTNGTMSSGLTFGGSDDADDDRIASNGTSYSGLQFSVEQPSQDRDRVASNGTQLTGLVLPAGR